MIQNRFLARSNQTRVEHKSQLTVIRVVNCVVGMSKSEKKFLSVRIVLFAFPKGGRPFECFAFSRELILENSFPVPAKGISIMILLHNVSAIISLQKVSALRVQVRFIQLVMPCELKKTAETAFDNLPFANLIKIKRKILEF